VLRNLSRARAIPAAGSKKASFAVATLWTFTYFDPPDRLERFWKPAKVSFWVNAPAEIQHRIGTNRELSLAFANGAKAVSWATDGL